MRANNTRQFADREPAEMAAAVSRAAHLFPQSSEKKPADPTREIEALRRENQELRGQLFAADGRRRAADIERGVAGRGVA